MIFNDCLKLQRTSELKKATPTAFLNLSGLLLFLG